MTGRLPLEVLEMEPMASGHRSLRLTREVDWDGFGPYAEAVVSLLGGRVRDRADSPAERVWSVEIDGRRYWLSFDDFGLGVSLDSKDAAANAHLDDVRARLAPAAATAAPRAGRD